MTVTRDTRDLETLLNTVPPRRAHYPPRPAQCARRYPQRWRRTLSRRPVMNKDHDTGRSPSPWSNSQSRGQPLGINVDARSGQGHGQTMASASSPYSAPPTSANRLPDRPQIPTRSSTVGSSELDRNASSRDNIPTARSEDLNHSNNYRPSPAFLRPSRPSTPTGSGSGRSHPPSSSGHSDDSLHNPNPKRLSAGSYSSARSGSSSSERLPPPSSSASSANTSTALVSVSS